MGRLVEQGSFSGYSSIRLDEARSAIPELSHYSQTVTVFLSHKHDDLEDLKGVIGFLQSTYGVKIYIDSQDKTMPSKTNGETAQTIKERIKECKKFILLATEAAVESKWCNWELGYGDAEKFKSDSIAVFPLKPKGTMDYKYKGNEYLQIYPYIAYYDGTSTYNDGTPIKRGYYICKKVGDTNYLSELGNWLSKK